MKKILAGLLLITIILIIVFSCTSSEPTLVCRQPFYDNHMKKCLYTYRNSIDSVARFEWCAKSHQQTFCTEKINTRRR